MANATSTQLQELYVAYFGRAADPSGLDYWTEQGITTSKFAADMHAQAEFKDVYGSLSISNQVNQIYKNLFDREADVDGLNYWTLQINLGKLQLAEIANDLIWAAQNNSGSSDDKTALTNRTNAAVAYTAKIKESAAAILAFTAETTSPWKAGDNLSEAVTYLSGIDKDTAHTAAGVAASVTTITNNGAPAGKKTFTLTTGVDSGSSFTGGSSADTFNANLSDTGARNTLNSFDELVGGGGLDTVYADVKTAVTPKTLSGIEVFNATFTGAVTLGLSNATSATTVNNVSSTENATFTGLAATATTLKVENIASDTTNFTYLSTTAEDQSATVAVDNVTGGTAAEIEIDGIETLTFNAGVATSSYEIAADDATTLNFGGDQDQTVVLDSTTLSVSKFDASSATGAVTLTTTDQTSNLGDLTVIGGSGNDSITTSGASQDISISGGAGNDTITHTAFATTDTVDGGEGVDTLSMLTADAGALDAATRTNITNVEAITITDEFIADLSTQLISTSIDTVNLTLANAAIIDEAENITAGAGSLTVNIGNKSTTTDGTLGAALTVTDTGTAVTDSVTIVNKAKLSTGKNVNTFQDNDITSTGYENVTINTGAGTGVDELGLATVTITPDAITGTAVSLTVTGTNSLDIDTSLTTTSTGLLTVDASGMTAQASTVETFSIDATSQGTAGTANITGSPGKDVIVTGNFTSTISGGAGHDALTGGTASGDSISGGDGNDTIKGGGGNDTLLGGAGNDTFTVTGTDVNIDAGAGNDVVNMDATLTSGDTVAGGDGTVDTLIVDQASTASAAEGVTGFEYLQADTALTQDMVLYTNNTGFTRLTTGAAATINFNNVYNTVTEFYVTTTAAGIVTTVFDRLLDNTSNSLTVAPATDAATSIRSLTVADEETLTLDDGAQTSSAAFIIGTLSAEDLVTLNVTGAANVDVAAISAQTTATLTTINASANTGTVDITASNATLALTATGSSTKANTLIGGSGADTITGGDVADTLTGNGGADSISGGDGADTITGGGGNDTMVGGAGADSLVAGTGTNTLTGGDGADTFHLDVSTGSDVAHDTVTDFDDSSSDLIDISIADVEALSVVTDLVELNSGSVTAASTVALLTGTLGGTLDFNGVDTNAQILAVSTNFASASAIQADIRTYLTVAGTFQAADAFLMLYDNGVDTTLATVTLGAARTNAVLTAATVTDVATFSGVSDATSIDANSFVVFSS